MASDIDTSVSSVDDRDVFHDILEGPHHSCLADYHGSDKAYGLPSVFAHTTRSTVLDSLLVQSAQHL